MAEHLTPEALARLTELAEAATPGECACGCGERPKKPSSKWVLGHNMQVIREQWLTTAVRGADECWPWPSVNAAGYGVVTINGRRVGAYRWVWERFVGPIPEGLHMDHLCRNRACVNPDHLEPVTQRENTYRGESFIPAQRFRTHCIHGHPFDEANTIWRGNTRRCRACRDAWNRARAKGRVA